MSRLFSLNIQAGALFISLMGIGVWLSAREPIGNDELYSQLNSVQKISYAGVLAGRAPEGNTCPLFYLIQKAVTDISGFNLPFVPGQYQVKDDRAQQVLRLAPNVCMSLTLTLIFYFFGRVYSWRWGAYALVLSLSSYMVLVYWAQARHYALWVLLSTMQLLVLIKLFSIEKDKGPWQALLTAVHVLMSLTVIFSIIQIALVALVRWLAGRREWRDQFMAFVLPTAIALYYYAQAPHYKFWAVHSFWELLKINMTTDLVCIGGFYAALAAVRWARSRQGEQLPFKFFLMSVLMYLAALALIGLMLYGQHPSDGFELTFRYFIFLTPMGIVTAVLLARELVRSSMDNAWLRAVVLTFLSGLLAIRVINAYIWALTWYSF